MLRALLFKTKSDGLRALSRETAREIVAVLGRDVQGSMREIARVLPLDICREEIGVRRGCADVSVLAGWRGSVRARRVAGSCGSCARAGRGRPCTRGYWQSSGKGLPAAGLVEAATAEDASGERIAANLVALNESVGDVHDVALDEMERLSERLVYRRTEDLGAEGYSAWASMIRDSARERGREAQRRVAALVLRFAMRLKGLAVSALIVETFFIVYKNLPKAKQRRIGGWASLFAPEYLWWMGFDEWGRRA